MGQNLGRLERSQREVTYTQVVNLIPMLLNRLNSVSLHVLADFMDWTETPEIGLCLLLFKIHFTLVFITRYTKIAGAF